jgi:hypothetical protein
LLVEMLVAYKHLQVISVYHREMSFLITIPLFLNHDIMISKVSGAYGNS